MFRHFAKLLVVISLLGLNACDDVPDPSLPNEPPVAQDDTVDVRQNQSFFIDILANDTDIDGDPLTIEITSMTSNGTVEALSTGARYTPELYFIGDDEFSYEITDLVGHTSSATVSIDVVKQETRAIFSTTSDDVEKLYMLDSRDPGTLVDLGQSLDAGETLLNWGISSSLNLAVLLTDADRILTVSLDDPATPAEIIEIDTTSGPVDGGLVISNVGTVGVYTLGNRYAVAFDLTNVAEPEETDAAFETGTMSPSFFNPLDNGIIMQGTLGTGAEERSAIYSVSLIGPAPIAILDDPDILQTTFARASSALNGIVWLTDSATMPVAPAAYSCATPPPQTRSPLFYTNLGVSDAGIDLIAGSTLLGDPTSVISYNSSPLSNGTLVAACPPATDIVQIVEIPFLSPETARILTTGDDASDGLWNIDIGSNGENVIYVFDGDTGLRTRSIDLTEANPVASDLTNTVPDFQTYTDGTELRLPPSLFSSDSLRWVFLAPVNDALTRLGWLQLETSEVSTVDLPFTATNLVSDGFFALVQGETGGTGLAPVALIDLNDPQITTVDVPGTLPETVADPLNQIESAVRLYLVP